MKEIVKLGLSLLLFCAVAALSLAFTNEMTKDTIQNQRNAKELQAKQAVLPDADEFLPVDEDVLSKIKEQFSLVQEVSEGKKSGELIGYVIKTNPNGYGGPVTVISGLDLNGVIMGVRVSKHSESPGLGSKSTEESFYSQYNSKLASGITVSKDSESDTEIKAISAATITSVAVTKGVNQSGDAVAALVAK